MGKGGSMSRDEIIREVEEYLASRESEPLRAAVAELKEIVEEYQQAGMAAIINQLSAIEKRLDAWEGGK